MGAKALVLLLKDYPVRFQRQKVIDNYIVDFYCHKAGLVIELDGGGHFTPEQKLYDVQRTEQLSIYHLKILRFTNLDIEESFQEVCSLIEKEVLEQELPQSPTATAPSRRER